MGPLSTQAVILRSIRYGEADRILHLYTPGRGRISAIAKGARRTNSRLGGRLEPFTHLEIDLYEGRSELMRVTGAATLASHGRLRTSATAIDAAARAADAVSRIFETGEPHPEVFNLLCNMLGRLDSAPAAPARPTALAFRLKLLVAAGLQPRLLACAYCAGSANLTSFCGRSGGVVCARCRSGAAAGEVRRSAFALASEARCFMIDALARPLADVPQGSPAALLQAERAIAETLGHHAHVRLLPATAQVAA